MKNPLEAAEDYTKQAGWPYRAAGAKRRAGCCFSERMRKLFRKNEKNVLRFCNKKAKEKRRLQRVKKPM